MKKHISLSSKDIGRMRIISKSTLVEYYTTVPQAKTALEEWYEKTKIKDIQNI